MEIRFTTQCQLICFKLFIFCARIALKSICAFFTLPKTNFCGSVTSAWTSGLKGERVDGWGARGRSFFILIYDPIVAQFSWNVNTANKHTKYDSDRNLCRRCSEGETSEAWITRIHRRDWTDGFGCGTLAGQFVATWNVPAYRSPSPCRCQTI